MAYFKIKLINHFITLKIMEDFNAKNKTKS